MVDLVWSARPNFQSSAAPRSGGEKLGVVGQTKVDCNVLVLCVCCAARCCADAGCFREAAAVFDDCVTLYESASLNYYPSIVTAFFAFCSPPTGLSQQQINFVCSSSARGLRECTDSRLFSSSFMPAAVSCSLSGEWCHQLPVWM